MRSGFLAALTLAIGFVASGASAAERGRIMLPSGPADVALTIDGRQRAKITLRAPDGTRLRVVELSSPADVLPVLIDRRFSFLWPELTAWAGPDLLKLRDRMLAESEAAYAAGKLPPLVNPMTGIVNRKAGVALSRAKVLTAAGRRAEAISFLEQQARAWTPGKPWDRADQGMVLIQLAALLADAGQVAQAADLLLAFEQQPSTRMEVMNVIINRANLLALAGRFNDALAAVDKGEALFISLKDTIGGSIAAIPGSSRYFAGVRACALRGLGRAQEAEAALAPLLTASPQPRSLIWEVSPTNEVELMTFACMRDNDRLAQALTNSLDAAPIAVGAFHLLTPQVATLYDGGTLTMARAAPAFVAAAGSTLRPLPAELISAANDWNEPAR